MWWWCGVAGAEPPSTVDEVLARFADEPTVLQVQRWAVERVEVRVGAAHFPPYTVRPEQGAGTGLLAQLIDAGIDKMFQSVVDVVQAFSSTIQD